MERINIDQILKQIASSLSALGFASTASEINELFIDIAVNSSSILEHTEDKETRDFIIEQVMTRLEHICNYNLIRVAFKTYEECTDLYEAKFKISMCKMSLKGDEDKCSEEHYLLNELLNTLSHNGSKRNTYGRN